MAWWPGTFVSPRQFVPGSSTHIAENSSGRPRGEANTCAGNGGNAQLRPAGFGPLKVFLAKRVVHAFLLDYDSKYQSCRKKNSSSLIDCREYSRSSNEDLPRTHFSAAWDRMHLIALLKDTPLNRLTGRPSMLSFWKDRAQPKRLRLVTSLNLIPRGSTVTSCKTEHFHHAWQCLTQVVQSYRIPPSKICINLLLPTLLQKSCWMITRTWVSDMSILQAMLDLKEQWMSKKLNPGWFLSTPYMKWIVYKLPHMQCIYIYMYMYIIIIYIYILLYIERESLVVARSSYDPTLCAMAAFAHTALK